MNFNKGRDFGGRQISHRKATFELPFTRFLSVILVTDVTVRSRILAKTSSALRGALL